MDKAQSPAIEELVWQLQEPLSRYAARILRDHDAAKDVVQESFVKYHGTAGAAGTAGISNPKAWLYRAVRNGCLDRIRSGRSTYEQRMAEDAEFGDPSPGPDRQLEKEEMMEMVRKKIGELPQREREIVVLKMEQDLSYKEIAEIMELSVTNVGFILHTVIKKLSAELRGFTS